MLTMAAATLLALSTVVTVDGTHGLDVPEPQTRIDVVVANGSGCPAGTAEISTHGRNFSISYHTFAAEAGSGVDPVDARKNCQLGIQVSLPPGYTYGLARSTYSGYIHLESGATALHRTGFYFQGSSDTTTLDFPFTGPITDQWRTTYRPAPHEIIYSPCGDRRNLNINSELRVDLGNSDRTKRNVIRADSSKGAVHAEYELTTKPC